MDQPFREDYLTYKDFKNFFVEGGKGEVLIFLHPLGGNLHFWDRNFPGFLDSHRVIALDFLGCGQSDQPDVPYALHDFCERVIALMDHLGVEQASLVGNSLGGHVALMLAAHYPTRVSKLVVANSSGVKAISGTILSGGILLSARVGRHLPFNPGDRSIRMVLDVIHGTKHEGNKFLTDFYASQMTGDYGARWKRAFVRTLESIISTNLDAELAEIDQPTLVIWGEKDRLLGMKGGKKLAGLIKNSALENYPDVGHFPQIDAPEKFNESVKAFLAKP